MDGVLQMWSLGMEQADGGLARVIDPNVGLVQVAGWFQEYVALHAIVHSGQIHL